MRTRQKVSSERADGNKTKRAHGKESAVDELEQAAGEFLGTLFIDGVAGHAHDRFLRLQEEHEPARGPAIEWAILAPA